MNHWINAEAQMYIRRRSWLQRGTLSEFDRTCPLISTTVRPPAFFRSDLVVALDQLLAGV